MIENPLFGLTSIFVFGIAAQWLAWRLRIPSILLLLLFGFIAGPFFGLLNPDELFGHMLLPLVSIFVAIILFEGGMGLKFHELRETGLAVQKLVTIGALITWGLSSLAAFWILGMESRLAILFGGILVVTGPTVIIPLLRHVRPLPKLGAVLRWEGILIDPIGALLAVLIFEVLMATNFSIATQVIFKAIAKTVLFGGVIGLTSAGFLYSVMRNYWVPDYLVNPISLTTVIAAYTFSNLIQHESGLLAVTVMGIALANQERVSFKRLQIFKEDLSLLLVSCIFILLAARIQPEGLWSVVGVSIPFLLVLILIIRPVSVFISTIGSGFSRKEKMFLAWMAPRGIVAAAVSSIFALRMEQAGFEQAGQLVPYTFFVIIGTVLTYSLTAQAAARRLHVSQPEPQGVLILGAHDWARSIAQALKEENTTVLLVDTNRRNVYEAKLKNLPAHHGNVFSETLLFDGIGYLVALTSNTECNALAAVNFSEFFGRAKVYQLPPDEHEPGSRQFSSPHLRGRYLFHPSMNYEQMETLFAEGATIKKTKLTSEFTYDHFKALYDQSAIPLFLIGSTGKVFIFSTDVILNPQPGQTVISLMRKEVFEQKIEKKKQEKSEKVKGIEPEIASL